MRNYNLMTLRIDNLAAHSTSLGRKLQFGATAYSLLTIVKSTSRYFCPPDHVMSREPEK